jgi:AraC-like DNA-binding protein
MPTTGIIAIGNLATSRRTIAGILGQFAFFGLSERQAARIFNDTGLPAHALHHPDFPVSRDQELCVYLALVRQLPANSSPAGFAMSLSETLGIEYFGVLGIAMRHAATLVDAMRISLTHPQLNWGHARLVLRRSPGAIELGFSMERPAVRDATAQEIDQLVEYCVAVDLVSCMRIIEDITERNFPPLRITLPFDPPPGWPQVIGSVTCPIEFNAAEAVLVFPAELELRPLPRANPLIFRTHEVIANRLSQMLAEEISFSERVTRWLWAQAPPLQRGEIASLMAMSERSLTRQLKAENTSYMQLLGEVQMERAMNYLRNPGLSVSATADRLGYSDSAAFSRAFSAWTGLSPLKWRQAQPTKQLI